MTFDLTFDISSTAIVVNGSGNLVTTVTGAIEAYIGGQADDTFIVNKDADFVASVDGQGGTNNSLDLSSFDFAIDVELMSIGSLAGFDGTVIGDWNIDFCQSDPVDRRYDYGQHHRAGRRCDLADR